MIGTTEPWSFLPESSEGRQFLRELFQSCLYDPKQKRSTAVLQTFDTSPFLLVSIWFLRLYTHMT